MGSLPKRDALELHLNDFGPIVDAKITGILDRKRPAKGGILQGMTGAFAVQQPPASTNSYGFVTDVFAIDPRI